MESRSGSERAREGDLDLECDRADELSVGDRDGDLKPERVVDRDLDLDRELKGERLCRERYASSRFRWRLGLWLSGSLCNDFSRMDTRSALFSSGWVSGFSMTS